MGILLSKIIPYIAEDLNIQINNEREFERFSRITSVENKNVCVYIADEQYIKKITDRIAMIITTPELSDFINCESFGICICEFPKTLYFRALNYVNAKSEETKNYTKIGTNCSINPNSTVYPNGVKIGNNVVIEEYAVIYPNTIIGDNSIIRAGAKIGIQDYNYYSEKEGMVHICHAGGVLIGSNVDIGYNTVVGRSLYNNDMTVIGDYSKVSHNCCIGHDVHIGNCTMIYSGAVVGGYTVIEDGVHITMNSTIKNGIKIGKNAMVCMGSNVIMNVHENTKVFGNPAKKMKI